MPKLNKQRPIKEVIHTPKEPQSEDVADTIMSPGWGKLLKDTILPEIKKAHRTLISGNADSSENYAANVSNLQLLHRILSKVYETANIPLPDALLFVLTGEFISDVK
jgi:hypothetical protein